MKKLLVFMAIFAISVFANPLVFAQGAITAHTEVFGDSTIDPQTSNITSHLSIGDDISSLKGSVDVSLVALKSDNHGRDKHMQKAIEAMKYLKTTYTISNVKKVDDHYKIQGTLDLHGVKKPLKLTGNIEFDNGKLKMDLKTSFLMSGFKIEPPKLLFLTVRDKIDMKINTTFAKQ